MSDLVSLSRVRLQLPNLGSCSDVVLQSLISAASSVIERKCRRSFRKANYDELQSGGGSQFLYVNNPPIHSVTAIRTGLLPAIYLLYSDPSNITQAANVSITSTGITLNTIFNNVPNVDNFPYADYPTFADLGIAVNALGNAWQATVSQQFALWQCSDLNIQGGFNARNNTVNLCVYWYGLPYFKWEMDDSGEVFYPGCSFIKGYQNYRVQYVGGFAEIPEAIQQATCELVQELVASRTANPLMQSETLDKYSYTRAAESSLNNLSGASKEAIRQFTLYRVARYD